MAIDPVIVERLKQMDPDLEICGTCQCCSLVSEDCGSCGGEGVSGHDCGEDSCCCEDPEDNVPCDACGGRGFHKMCIGGCSSEGVHARRSELEEPDGN